MAILLTHPSEYVTGELYFRDSLTIESMDTFKIDGETNYHRQFLTFNFDNFAIEYNYQNHKLSYYRRTDFPSTNDSTDHSITISYFFEQQIEIHGFRVNLLSFVSDISVGDEYRIYKVHGYFNNKITDLTIRNEDLLSPFD